LHRVIGGGDGRGPQLGPFELDRHPNAIRRGVLRARVARVLDEVHWRVDIDHAVKRRNPTPYAVDQRKRVDLLVEERLVILDDTVRVDRAAGGDGYRGVEAVGAESRHARRVDEAEQHAPTAHQVGDAVAVDVGKIRVRARERVA